jgi:catechol 2,3-dioxygenase-like lactoylglutathione lyase family enzyme
MIADRDASANLAVKDLAAARNFYEHTLGLTPVETEGDEAVVYRSGHSTINVYRSQYAGTNQATAVSWSVNDIEGEVDALKKKGVRFEHYELPDMKLEGDVHVGPDMKCAWFKDPDGNILHLMSH